MSKALVQVSEGWFGHPANRNWISSSAIRALADENGVPVLTHPDGRLYCTLSMNVNLEGVCETQVGPSDEVNGDVNLVTKICGIDRISIA